MTTTKHQTPADTIAVHENGYGLLYRCTICGAGFSVGAAFIRALDHAATHEEIVDPSGRLPGDVLIQHGTEREFEVIKLGRDAFGGVHYRVRRYGRPDAPLMWMGPNHFMSN